MKTTTTYAKTPAQPGAIWPIISASVNSIERKRWLSNQWNPSTQSFVDPEYQSANPPEKPVDTRKRWLSNPWNQETQNFIDPEYQSKADLPAYSAVHPTQVTK